MISHSDEYQTSGRAKTIIFRNKDNKKLLLLLITYELKRIIDDLFVRCILIFINT